jgi:predicted DNA-binding transcriptional regulator AlpA
MAQPTAAASRGRQSHSNRVTTVALPLEPLLSPEDLSDLLRIPVETLYQWRRQRIGPPAFRVGRHLRYEPAEVRTWIQAQKAEAA